MRNLLAPLALGLALLAAPSAPAANTEPLLKTIKAVGREGDGNAAASEAWKALVAVGPDALIDVLKAMRDQDPVSSNWLRPAVDAILENAPDAAKKQSAPLEKFVLDTTNAGSARRLAYEILVKADPTTPSRLLPGMLQDPNPDLRHDAVALALKQARDMGNRRRDAVMALASSLTMGAPGTVFLQADDKPAVLAAYRKALSGAIDQDQVDEIAEALKPLGVVVDPANHFGFIRQWHLLHAFDNAGGAGFKTVYPPEKGVDLKATYAAKEDPAARWVAHTTKDAYGLVDLNKVLSKKKAVVGYAYAVIDSPEERPVEIRAGSYNAIKIFLNGKEIFARDEYHHGMQMDQHVGTGTLKKGKNEILIKLCQNDQKEPWAQSWSFQVRLSDTTGVAVPFTQAKE